MNRQAYTARLDVPDFGDGSVTLEVVAWHVAEGQQVRTGQPIVSLRSGRSMIKLPSPHSGKVVTLYVNPLDKVVVGSALAEIELESAATAANAAQAVQQRSPTGGRGEEQSMSSNNRDRLDTGASASARAAPAVRSLAKKLGVDLEKCVGTGRDGMITMNDVIARTNQAKASRAGTPAARPPQTQSANQPTNPAPSPVARRANPEPVSVAPVATPSRPVSTPSATPPRGWMSDLQAQTPSNPPSVPAPTPVARAQPRTQPPPAQTWATMEDELPAEPEPRIIATRLQDLSSYDFPSAERQPAEPQAASNPYTPGMSWFTTEEGTSSDQETLAPARAEPFRALNPWGAVEVEEQGEQSAEQPEYDYSAEAASLEVAEEVAEEVSEEVAEAVQVEAYAELDDEEPAADTEQGTVDSDWETPVAEKELAEDALAEDELAEDLTPYDAETPDPAVMTTVYEAPAAEAAAADLTPEADWVKPARVGPETPAEWAQPEYASYANTASAGVEARAVPQRAPSVDIAPRPLIDQEDRLHGQRRNMALNMTRARDEVATCTMFDDADLNAWSNYTDLTVRLLRAIVAGIHAEPGFNATFDPAGPSRRLLRQINVAVAVDTREGLTVPVLRDVGSRSLEDLREYVYFMKERTRTRTLTPDDLRDFSFSLANYGILAGRYATPLVIPPTVATLGCGRLERAVVAGETAPEIHAMLPLSLSFDHRCVTMGEACRFLAALKQDLELAQ